MITVNCSRLCFSTPALLLGPIALLVWIKKKIGFGDSNRTDNNGPMDTITLFFKSDNDEWKTVLLSRDYRLFPSHA